DRQPESRAEVFRIVVNLHERLENQVALVRGNAFAGIDHVDGALLAVEPGLHSNAAPPGELDRVRDEIDDDLANALAIAHQSRREAAENLCFKLQSARISLCAGFLHRLLQQAGEREAAML